MSYSPKLKKAIAEIKKIMEEYDVAGVVAIHTPGHAETLYKIDPSYSCAKLEWSNQQGLNMLRIKATEKDCNGDKKKRDQMLSDTVNMFSLLEVTVGKMAYDTMEAMDLLKKHLDIKNTDTDFTSDQEILN